MKNIEEIRKVKGVALVDIADLLGVDSRTVRSKIDGVSDFKFGETVAIKKAFFPEYELEYLFSERAEA
ncbi:MAG: helix-turn-helix domain protein [Bacteriophage sp.]|nr:MAG: helix-turn-helix domain protein [Bacteriophage sp.]